MRPSASVLGCRVDLLNRAAIIEAIERSIDSESLLHVLTLNPEQVMATRSDYTLGQLIGNADLVTIDGTGLALALRLQGKSGFDRVTGVEITNAICAAGWPVYLLGGRPGAAERAAENLRAKHPASRVCGAWSGGVAKPSDDEQTIRRIAESKASIVLVAYGFPAQNAWIERNRADLEQIGVRVGIGVGGALDFASGLASPAPNWVSRIGLEWLYRLIREPWRWRRQLVLPVFAVLASAEAIRIRLRGK